MSLEYALITSSSLPDEIKGSEYYVKVDKAQWLDLIDYSEDLVHSDPDQKVLFLIVAKGTPDQEKADADRKRQKEMELKKLQQDKDLAEQKLLDQEAADIATKQAKHKASLELRKKSESIFNALYKR